MLLVKNIIEDILNLSAVEEVTTDSANSVLSSSIKNCRRDIIVQLCYCQQKDLLMEKVREQKDIFCQDHKIQLFQDLSADILRLCRKIKSTKELQGEGGK